MGGTKELYGGQDPRLIPAYSVEEAAHHLQLPRARVRAWVFGRGYRVDSGPRELRGFTLMEFVSTSFRDDR
jgi:hypothetical protein